MVYPHDGWARIASTRTHRRRHGRGVPKQQTPVLRADKLLPVRIKFLNLKTHNVGEGVEKLKSG